VDTETGAIKLLKLWDAHDVGKAINPSSVESQIEGSLAMGLGYTFKEDLKIKNGKVVNAGFAGYKVPRSVDIPEMETILVETNDPKGPFGAKGMGEAALLPTAAAIANAVYDAVGVRLKELPFTPDKVIRALKEKENMLKSGHN
jgi:CO/xanthine dehydrogenase Mo-binding subunit